MRTCLELAAAVDFLLEPLRSKAQKPSATMSFVNDIKILPNEGSKNTIPQSGISMEELFRKLLHGFDPLNWRSIPAAKTGFQHSNRSAWTSRVGVSLPA